MLEFINKNHLGLTLIINIFGICVNSFFAWCSYRQRTKANKELEKYKAKLLIDNLKNEKSIKKRFEIYAKLLLAFTRAKSIINGICAKKHKKDLIAAELVNQAKLLINDAVGFMEKNLLFISKEVSEHSDSSMILMNEFENIMDDGTRSYMVRVRDSIDNLVQQMKKELSIEH